MYMVRCLPGCIRYHTLTWLGEPGVFESMTNCYRYNNRCNSHCAHFVIVQFLLSTFLASHFIPDLQCSLSTAERSIDRHLLATRWSNFFERVLRCRELDMWFGQERRYHCTRPCCGRNWRRWSDGYLDICHIGSGSSSQTRCLARHW